MNNEYLEDVLIEFIENEEKKVCIINGEWGIGKTVFFNKFLEKYRERLAQKYQNYSYISLFGINELSELNSKIIYGTKDLSSFTSPYSQKKIRGDNFQGQEKNTFCEQSQLLLKKIIGWIWRQGKKIFNYIWRLKGVIQYLGGITPPKYFLIKKQLICFDDIERMDSKFSIETLLGTIDELTNQRKCKVVIIINEIQLNKNEFFHKYREKVVDVEVTYAPSLESNFNIAFDKTTLENEWKDIIQKRCLKLKIDNIRVLKKIRFALENYRDRIKEHDVPQIVRDRFIGHFVSLYSLYLEEREEKFIDVKNSIFIDSADSFSDLWAKHSASLEAKRIASMLGNDEKNEEDPKIKEAELFADLMNKYYLSSSFMFDNEFIFYINNGYISSDFIAAVAKSKSWYENLQHEAKVLECKNKISKIWDLYHSTLQDNLDDIINVLDDLIKDEDIFDYLNVRDFFQFMKNFYSFQKVKDSEYDVNHIYFYIDKYMAKNEQKFLCNDQNSLLTSIEFTSFGLEKTDLTIDHYAREKINELRISQYQSINVWDLLKKNYEVGFSSKEEKQLLENITKDQYIELFEKCEDPELTRVIKQVYRDLKSLDKESELELALNEIAEKSKFSADRVAAIKRIH